MNCCKFCDKAYQNGRWSLIEFEGSGVWVAMCQKHKKMLIDVLCIAEGNAPVKGVNLDDFNGKV